MVIGKKSKELLNKLRTTNYRQLPDIGMDTVSEKIIEIIANECKSTLLITDNEGNLQSRRYESDIINENLHQIIRQLILNGGTIPREVMNRIMCSNGMIMGVNSDIQLYKGIQEKEDGSMEMTATIGNAVIDLQQLDAETLKLLGQEIYDRYARQFVLANSKKLPPMGRLSIFKEKMLHGREDGEFIAKQFTAVLKSKTRYSDEIIASTVQYHLDYMYSDKFKRNILETMNSGTGLVPLDSKGKNVSFNHLLEAVSAETQDMVSVIPNINQIHKDISQAYADVETQLTAYSTDITGLDATQIEESIKQINRTSLINPELQKHIGKSGYRNVNVGVSNNSVKLVQHQNVPGCMQRLSKDIQELVQNSDTMEQDDYLKRAVQLQYRFIRIHPFRDSNGRTSRALLNMMTIPKGILIEVPKEIKSGFVQAQRDTNKQVDGQGYFEALSGNLEALDQIEAANLDSPTYEFIRQNCVIDIKWLQFDNATMQNQRGNQAVQQMPEEQEQ